MARLNSFYFPPDNWPVSVGDTVLLKGDEARHMVTVLRTDADQTVRLFDGAGRDGLFRVVSTSKKAVTLVAQELNEHPAPDAGVTLAIGWGKSKRRNYLFEKAVELHAGGIAFWDAQRSQGKVPAQPKDTWQDKCIQAAKQCGSTHLPSLSTMPGGVQSLVEFATNFDQCYLAWESDEATQPLSPGDLNKGRSLIVIGPEGGLEDEEAQALLKAGFTPVTLGDSILRWETAATYCMSLGWYARQER